MYLVVFFIIIFSGCKTFIPDPSISSYDAGYPSAEFYVNGRQFHGSGEVLAYKGQDLSTIDLKIQGYYEGVIKVNSNKCHLDISQVYRDHELYKVPLSDGFGYRLEKSCIIDFIVQVTLPGRGRSLDPQLRGSLLVKVLPQGVQWVGKSSKIPSGGDDVFEIRAISSQKKAKVVSFGCGDSPKTKYLEIKNNHIYIPYKDICDKSHKGVNHISGLVYTENVVTRFDWRVWIYNEIFAPLPFPHIDSYAGNGITDFKSDISTAVIGFDKDFSFKAEEQYIFNPNDYHTFRAFTLKGRNVICEWIPDERLWSCKK